MKIKYMGMLIALAMLLIGCGNKTDKKTVNNENKPDFDKVIEKIESNQNNTPSEGFSMNLEINVFDGDEPVGFKIKPSIGEKSLKVYTRVFPDKSLADEKSIMRFFVVKDGQLLQHSIDGSNYNEYNDVEFVPEKENYNTITFDVTDDFNTITILCLVYPTVIPGSGGGMFTGGMDYVMHNETFTSFDANEDNDFMYQESVPYAEAADIGIKTIEDGGLDVWDNHYAADVNISSGDNLYLKFYNKTGNLYYAFLLIDGKLVDCFDDDISTLVDNKEGSRFFQYCLDGKYTSQKGLHTYQLLCVPTGSIDNVDSILTHRIRVNIE